MGMFDWLFGSGRREGVARATAEGDRSPADRSRGSASRSADRERFDRSRAMLREATRLKETHPKEAIEKIKEAIRTCPEKVLEDHFKLASYLAGGGHFDEAFAVLRKLASEESPRDYFFFNMNLSSIEEKMASVLFLEKRWTDSVYYACLSTYRRCVALSAQGRYAEIEFIVGKSPLGERKGKEAFQEMGIAESRDEFEEAFKKLLESQLPELKRLSDLSPWPRGEKKCGAEFTRLFRDLSSSTFDAAYRSRVQPTLGRSA